jgi:hypothetical protein
VAKLGEVHVLAAPAQTDVADPADLALFGNDDALGADRFTRRVVVDDSA